MSTRTINMIKHEHNTVTIQSDGIPLAKAITKGGGCIVWRVCQPVPVPDGWKDHNAGAPDIPGYLWVAMTTRTSEADATQAALDIAKHMLIELQMGRYNPAAQESAPC